MAAPVEKILILGGTKEASELAAELVAAGKDVTTSLAGRTREPQPVAGKVRIGGFGGAEGLAAYLRDNQITHLVDCTHPFAKTISANAILAAKLTGIPLEIRTRRPWEKVEGDLWIEVQSLEEAATRLTSGSRVLLALGKQHLDAFSTRTDCQFFIRMVDAPEAPLRLGPHELIVGKPSADWKEEAALFERLKIDTIVCRNSGGQGAYAKIVASRVLRIPVIIEER